MPDKLASLRFPARTEELQTLRDKIREILKQQACSESFIDEVVLALNEACMNIIQHAYGEAEQQGDVILEIFSDADWLIFRLTDFAPTIDKTQCQSRELDDLRPGGLGLHFIQNLMDEHQFLEPPGDIGNIQELRKQIR